MNKTLFVLMSLALMIGASPLAAASAGADNNDLVCVNLTECLGELAEYVWVVYYTVWELIGPIRI